jgi:hypothetical protein
VQTALRQFGVARFGIACAKCNAHQTFAIGEKVAEIVGSFRIDDAAQFDVIPFEHDAPVAGAPFAVPAARRNGKA